MSDHRFLLRPQTTTRESWVFYVHGFAVAQNYGLMDPHIFMWDFSQTTAKLVSFVSTGCTTEIMGAWLCSGAKH